MILLDDCGKMLFLWIENDCLRLLENTNLLLVYAERIKVLNEAFICYLDNNFMLQND